MLLDYEEDIQGHVVSSTECSVENVIVSTEPKLDLAALDVKCPQPFGADRILSFLTSPVDLGAQVYVIGHPNGSFKTVSDNALVRYPYRVTAGQLTLLKNGVRTEFEQRYGAAAASSAVQDFTQSYVQPTPPDGFYYYNSLPQRWQPAPPAPIPAFGFDSNTDHGSSGSPVFVLNAFRIAGIFVGGDKDQSVGPYSWLRQNHILP